MSRKIIFFGDSIIENKSNRKISSWSIKLKKLIKSNSRKKNNFFTYAYSGLNSRKALDFLPNILIKNKNIHFIIIQIGINDSWHFESLKGLANVSEESFRSNLNEIYLKCKKFQIKNIIFLTYHKLLKNRVEINKKNLNQNLDRYTKIIKKFCTINNLLCIDILKETKNIDPKILCKKLPDGVHLSEKGTEIYSKIIFKNLKKFYEKEI
tara:strand:- start:653 stop:1279 length:627 start_codon:yes stop_codon:yes gene_type:complete